MVLLPMSSGRGPDWRSWIRLSLALGLTACTSSSAPVQHPDEGVASSEPPPGPSEEADPEAHLGPRERLARKKAEQRAALADEPLVELPLEQLRTGHIVAPMQVQGEELVFILDTGASTSVITPATQARLGWKDEDGTPVAAQGANGAMTDVRIFSLDEARMGPRTYRDLGVAVMDLGHLEAKLDRKIAGILGRNFLSRHELEVDFGRGTLRLHPPGSVSGGQVNLDGLADVPYGAFRAGLIKIQVSLDGSDPFPAVLDLGAARSVINLHAAAVAGHPGGKGLDPAPEALLGADDRPLPARLGRFERLTLGTATFEGPELHVADLGVFETLGVDEGPAMVLGLDLVRGRRVIIDYSGQHLYLDASAPGPAGEGS